MLNKKHINKFMLFLLLIILFIFQQIKINAAEAETGIPNILEVYDERIFESSENYPRDKLPYRIYIPDDYEEKSYPLVLHLNGAGQNGTDNKSHIEYPYTLAHSLLEDGNMEKYPCIIVAPQCPVESRWVTNFYGGISKTLHMALELINEICERYNVDKSRLYITGYSTGANGVWDLMYRYPDMFAAGAAFAGYTAPAFAETIKNMPIWVFHAQGDSTVPVTQSRNMVDALTKAGSTTVQYTECEGDAHNLAWITAYRNDEFLQWLFSQQRTDIGDNIEIKKSSEVLAKSKRNLLTISAGMLISLFTISIISLPLYRKYLIKETERIERI